MKTSLIFVAFLTCVSSLAQNKVAFFNVDPKTQAMDVILDKNPTGQYLIAANYRVVSLSSALPEGEWKWIQIAKVDVDPNSTSVLLTPISPNEVRTAAQLMLLIGSDPGVFKTKASKAPNEPLKKASKESSDIYLNFSFSPGINSEQQFSIDSSVGMLFGLAPASDSNFGSLGFLGAVKTDKRKEADPDSYRVFGVYQRPLTDVAHWPLQGVLFTWLVGGAEFERAAKNTNFISSPLLDFPLRLRGHVSSATQILPVLSPEIGVELGNNFGNALEPTGQGFVARGVVGANFSVNFNPKTKLFQGIHLSSNYKLRLPAQAEVFTNTKLDASGKTVDVPSLSTSPRHYIKSELGFTLWEPISFSITHEYGTIPPAFRLVDHKVAIGLTLSLQQTNHMTGGLTGK